MDRAYRFRRHTYPVQFTYTLQFVLFVFLRVVLEASDRYLIAGHLSVRYTFTNRKLQSPSCQALVVLSTAGHLSVRYTFTNRKLQSPSCQALVVLSTAGHLSVRYTFTNRKLQSPSCQALVVLSTAGHLSVRYTFTNRKLQSPSCQALVVLSTAGHLSIKRETIGSASLFSRDVTSRKELTEKPSICIGVPSARILGGPDLHVDIGSTINLTCLIQFSPEPPAYIFWYHEDEVISYDSSRGGVSVVTEKGAATTSYLLVQAAAPADSGRYSCSPSNAEVASVRVHIGDPFTSTVRERPAAMQTGSAGLSNSARCVLALLAALALHARLVRAHLAS
ncbi:Uncharacterized protein OBRU01_00319 [Operophtera brumata]|uniref:Ig-like domain-containing protein n=1 Tax=Operophtera brumata TaxID=104452 RepID=A0A0L7LVK9_OPEBR|nr:Uncharacterized protein OBRU01_00319 [Operophtera brumata]